MKRCHFPVHSLLFLFLMFGGLTFADRVVDVRGKTLSRGTDKGMAYAKFKAHKFSYLNISNIGSDYVMKGSECGLACVNIPLCFSFNLAALQDVIGKLLCELLPSDIYNNSEKFVANHSHHHFSITSPCISWPCQNKGTCTAHYEKNSYVCVCTKGYTGKHCEIDIDECAEDSHTCDVKTHCANTVGSYICTCKPTYYRNGETCRQIALNASSILSGLDRDKYLGVLVSYLSPVLMDLNRSVFLRCWHAKTDGWAAATFHNNCDGKGPTVTIIQVNSHIFGGYTNVSWNAAGNRCSCVLASKAFIFSLHNINGYAPVKLSQHKHRGFCSMRNCPSLGPSFGYADIRVANDAVNKNDSFTHCGCRYTPPPRYSHKDCPFFAGTIKFSPTNIEVFYEVLP
ncbi:uncharacterized protein LOC111344323 [Stylophora pistillata]|uniref:uncharacterized protein LOC111344323 n=1 Tax=Stylophora pistillata TaxID=50429 RepID=UPI000C04F04C|nr:uncharacterized protein LOC111344323 [Stylophora pistillata]